MINMSAEEIITSAAVTDDKVSHWPLLSHHPGLCYYGEGNEPARVTSCSWKSRENRRTGGRRLMKKRPLLPEAGAITVGRKRELLRKLREVLRFRNCYGS